MSVKTMLREEVQDELKEIKKLQIGSDEHKTAVDSLTKLVDKMVELEKAETEREDKRDEREFEREFKTAQAKSEQTDRHIKNGLTAAGIVSSVGLAVWGAIKTWKFEETGTITSTAGRQFIGKLFRK